MIKQNLDLRLYAKGQGVPLWAIADNIGISEQTLIRQWRQELSNEDKLKIRKIIENLKSSKT